MEYIETPPPLLPPPFFSQRYTMFTRREIDSGIATPTRNARPRAARLMEIEYNYRNLLLPVGGEFVAYRQRALYIFTIYRADGLPDMSSFCMKSDYENINPFVQISFAGMKVNRILNHTLYLYFPFSSKRYNYPVIVVFQQTTREEWQTYRPHFNQKIIFNEMFPSLCQRVRIAIKHRVNTCRTCVVASYILNLAKIFHSGKYGKFEWWIVIVWKLIERNLE